MYIQSIPPSTLLYISNIINKIKLDNNGIRRYTEYLVDRRRGKIKIGRKLKLRWEDVLLMFNWSANSHG